MRDRHCTIAELFQALGGKWVLPVFYQIQREEEPKRFGQLQRAVGSITTSELTKALRHLEKLGLLHREQFNEVPLRVEYRLTELGASLRKPMEDLASWLITHKDEVVEVLLPKNRSTEDAKTTD